MNSPEKLIKLKYKFTKEIDVFRKIMYVKDGSTQKMDLPKNLNISII